MKEIISKLKTLPKAVRVFFLAMIAGAIGAGIMSIFRIELGTLWRNVYFIILLVLAYLYVYKPFKKE